MAKKVVKNYLEPLEEVRKVLKEFLDVFSPKLLDVLPPMRDIQHAINLVPSATLSNFPHNKMNPDEHIKLQRQPYELL